MSKVTIKIQLQKSKVGRVILRVYHYIYSVPMSFFRLIKYRLMRKDQLDIHFYKDSEVFDFLIKEKKSLSRFGDGEISWIYKESKGYFGQENSDELSSALKDVIDNPPESLIIGIPNFFGEMEGYKKSRKRNREIHLSQYYYKWKSLLSNERYYADALITRVYNGREGIDFNAVFNKWKEVWESKRIVVIEGSETRFGVGNDLLSNASSVRRIICPAENAFAVYPKIRQSALQVSDADLFILALGPTASVLACDLAKEGYQAIDIGHLDIEYEWYLAKADGKEPVRGKYVNEAGGSSLIEFDSETISNYHKEVICRVGM